ncbi:thiamine phosphate synthase [Sphingomonas segetis]|jgi:thiamine-phosphate pyrophosphorylase|uniref:thiamine phosphate synthase n=1 Tax=Sphingomonas segetis TaxID=1104779 RepID=UPI0012D2D115
MRRRQRVPRQWLIVESDSADPTRAMSRLDRGSGVLVLGSLPAGRMRQLRRVARQRELMIAKEHPGTATRVHDVRELRGAVLRRTPLILLSPIFPTPSHPDWPPIPRMRAAALARLAGRRLIALGGMDARKFARIENLGFRGWAGISAFRT